MSYRPKNLDDKLSSASAKSELDNDELDKKLSSLAEEYDKSGEDITDLYNFA